MSVGVVGFGRFFVPREGFNFCQTAEKAANGRKNARQTAEKASNGRKGGKRQKRRT